MPEHDVIAPPDSFLHATCSSCGHPLSLEEEVLRAAPTTAPATRPLDPVGRFAPGSLVADRYRMGDILGSGGAGEVYRAQDLTLNHPVALKLFPHLDKDDEALERLRREVRLARQISHGNVCRVFDIGETAGHPFITMEFVSGEDLHALLRRIGHLSPDKALQVSRQLCAGLAAAHEAGVLHRDLKLANIMLDARGNVRITDFGLAILAAEPHQHEGGTPGYMAPEQLAGKEATAQSDIYALGLVLYELFTGKRALEPRNASDLVRVTRRIPPLPMPGVHPLIQQTIARCLEPNPSKRPGSVIQVAAVLSRAARLGAAVVAHYRATPQTPPKMHDLMPRLAWSLLACSLAGSALTLMLAPSATGIGLAFDSKGPDGSVAHIFTWLWCLALQLFLTLAAMAFVLRTRPSPDSQDGRAPDRIDDPAYLATLQ